MLKTLAILLLVLPPTALRAGDPDPDTKLRAEIRQAVRGRHAEESADWWKERGPTAPRVITSLYTAETNTHTKLRLLGALSYFDDAETVGFLKKEAKETTNSVVRQTAIRALVQSQGMKESEFVTGFLQNPDPRTRLATAEALQRLGDAGAQQTVDNYLKTEKETWVVERVKRAQQPKTQTLLKPKPIE
jgi:hypothetical protein